MKALRVSVFDWVRQLAKYPYGLLPPSIRLGGIFRETRALLRESEHWCDEDLESYQLQQLAKLLTHAYENVPFYRSVFEERGFHPSDIQTFQDLRELPLLTKETFQAKQADFVSLKHSKKHLVPANTGGTTGSPLHFYYEKGLTIPRSRAFVWQMWNWHGYHWGDRCVIVTGAFAKEHQVRYDPVQRSLFLYNPGTSAKEIETYVKLLKAFQPHVIRGYPSLIYLFARSLNRRGIRLQLPMLKVVFCSSEKLFEFQKAEIAEAFRCKVIDHYGHNEMVVFMSKCSETSEYHVMHEYGVTEILGSDGAPVSQPGELGEIVGTGFNNYAFPMIRYRTGDWAKVSGKRCDCGRAHPLVKEVVGRSGDFILTPSGKLISPTVLEFAIRYIEHFQDVQVCQIDRNLIEIQVVPDEYYSESEGSQFAKGVRSRIGEAVSVKVVLVDKIERPQNQKRRFVKSDISRQFINTRDRHGRQSNEDNRVCHQSEGERT